MDNELISVIVPVYNSEKTIERCIKSVLAQTYCNWELILVDDGSIDKTREVLKQYELHAHVIIMKDKNIGCAKSFLELMKAAYNMKDQFDYFSFCDQDDFWMPEKLFKASHILNEMDNSIPCLYFSNLYVVDANLNNPRLLFNNKDVSISKRHALIESFCTGCTMVFNKKALDLYLNTPIRQLRIHDKRLFHMCLFLGKIYYDEDAYIKYRQHANNVIGANAFFSQRIRSKIKSLKQLPNQHVREEEAKELIYSFNNMLSEQDKEIILEVANYRTKWYYRYNLLFNKEYKMTKKVDNFWSKIRILIGHI